MNVKMRKQTFAVLVAISMMFPVNACFADENEAFWNDVDNKEAVVQQQLHDQALENRAADREERQAEHQQRMEEKQLETTERIAQQAQLTEQQRLKAYQEELRLRRQREQQYRLRPVQNYIIVR